MPPGKKSKRRINPYPKEGVNLYKGQGYLPEVEVSSNPNKNITENQRYPITEASPVNTTTVQPGASQTNTVIPESYKAQMLQPEEVNGKTGKPGNANAASDNSGLYGAGLMGLMALGDALTKEETTKHEMPEWAGIQESLNAQKFGNEQAKKEQLAQLDTSGVVQNALKTAQGTGLNKGGGDVNNAMGDALRNASAVAAATSPLQQARASVIGQQTANDLQVNQLQQEAAKGKYATTYMQEEDPTLLGSKPLAKLVKNLPVNAYLGYGMGKGVSV